jgi:hypothetical protein
LEETRNAYSILTGKTEGKRPLGRPRRGWKDNIKIDIGETGWVYVVAYGTGRRISLEGCCDHGDGHSVH